MKKIMIGVAITCVMALAAFIGVSLYAMHDEVFDDML